MSDIGVQLGPRRPSASVASEALGAVLPLTLAALLLFLLLASLHVGRDESAGQAPLRPGPAPDYRTGVVSAEQATVIIVTGTARGEEVEELLARETELRALLGERERDANVVVASDLAAAESIADSIREQAAIPGLPALRPVLVTAP
jgi:hypothetical protein